MIKVKYWWEETEQCPRFPEYYTSIKFDDNATEDEIEKAVRQAVFENFEWGFGKEVSE